MKENRSSMRILLFRQTSTFYSKKAARILTILLILLSTGLFFSCTSSEEKYKELLENLPPEFTGNEYPELNTHFSKIKRIVHNSDNAVEVEGAMPEGEKITLRFGKRLTYAFYDKTHEERGIKVLNDDAFESIDSNTLILNYDFFSDDFRDYQQRTYSFGHEDEFLGAYSRANAYLENKNAQNPHDLSFFSSIYENYCTDKIRLTQLDKLKYFLLVKPLEVIKPEYSGASSDSEYDGEYTMGYFLGGLYVYDYTSGDLLTTYVFLAQSSEELSYSSSNISTALRNDFLRQIGSALEELLKENFNIEGDLPL